MLVRRRFSGDAGRADKTRSNIPCLWPPPRTVEWLGGAPLRVPEHPTGGSAFAPHMPLDKAWHQFQAARVGGWVRPNLQRASGRQWLRIERVRDLPPEGYRLEVRARKVTIEAATVRGARHAFATLHQLARGPRRAELPAVRIEDWPDFPVRGCMLDISRGKVPRPSTLYELVAHLARLKYNHLQLYTEHTFAFPGHETVWGDASPMTAGQVRDLQKVCESYGIELAANFNSFGHFERWLKHPEYRHLAECPDGFTHPLKGRVPHGTTLRPNAASLRFLDGLWSEYLPLFKSPRFNLGGDEPWELGQGWSKARVKKLGKHRVYLDFLKKLHRQAARHGKQMLFWADILLEAPDLVGEVPADAIALLWGYEAHHPFAEQCAKLAAAQRKFWVCPGTSAWNTFTGRTDNMLANIESAAKYGLAHGAEGLLLTSWGDGGNHQPWPTMYPALVYGAGLAWNRAATRREDLPRALDFIFSAGRASGFGRTLLELGRVENLLARTKHNCSRHHAIFFAARPGLAAALDALTLPELARTAAALARLRRRLARLRGLVPGERHACEELLLGADMAAWAVKRAQRTLARKNIRPLAAELRELIGRFEEIWLLRARPGGLHESSARMRAIEKEL